MAKSQLVRSSMEISDDIATVLEKAEPSYYWPEEHDKNAKEVNDFLCGRRMVVPKAYLSEIRRQAVQSGRGEEIKPLITEARRFLALQAPPKEKRPRRAEPGR